MSFHPVLLNDWLITAVLDGHVERVRALIAQGADVNGRTHDGGTIISLAAHQDSPEIVRLLVRAGASVEDGGDDGSAPLQRAICFGNPHAATAMIDAGANVQRTNPLGETPLLEAVRRKQGGLVKRLIDVGANVNAGDYLGQTPLIEAVRARRPVMVKQLLEAGADVNAMDEVGNTPMSLAEELKVSDSIVNTLRQAGAVPSEPRVLKIAERGSTSGWARRNVQSPPSHPEYSADVTGRRGVNTFDFENALIFVRAPAEAVAEALVHISGATEWLIHVEDTDVILSKQCCAVVQLKGHLWSIVIHKERRTDSDAHAQQLSEVLATNAVAYVIGRPAEAIRYVFEEFACRVPKMQKTMSYVFYEDGQAVEYFFHGKRLEFISSLRDDELNRIARDPKEFVHRVFWEQGIYEPGLRFAHLVRGNVLTEDTPVRFLSDDLQRIDLLRLPDAGKGVYVSPLAKLTIANPPFAHISDYITKPRPFNNRNVVVGKAGRVDELRGVRTFEYDNVVLLVEAPVERTAEAIRHERDWQRWIKEVRATDIEPTSEAAFVFQLKGHNWSVVLDGEIRSDYEVTARAVSRSLDTQCFALGIRGPEGAVVLRWYANGYQLERFQSGVGEKSGLANAFDLRMDRPLNPPEGIVSTQWAPLTTGEDGYRGGAIQSLARRIDSAGRTTVEEFVDVLLRDQHAFEPGLTYTTMADWLTNRQEPGPYRSDDFVRVDCLVSNSPIENPTPDP
jgi:ankyrin repeat protein